MHLTDHISDVQLNEYLDHETKDRARIEMHLSACRDCTARLAALQDLFSEIESLPDLAVSPALAAPFVPNESLSEGVSRSLLLTISLQAALAMAVILFAAPFVMDFLSPYLSGVSLSSPLDLFFLLQAQWTTWLDMLSQVRLPSVPELPSLPISGLVLTLTLLGASLLWLIGNGLLLREQVK